MPSLMELYLDAVHHDAESIAHYARELDNHAAFIGEVPSFRTAAEAALASAETNLKVALLSVRKARAGIRPIELRVAS